MTRMLQLHTSLCLLKKHMYLWTPKNLENMEVLSPSKIGVITSKNEGCKFSWHYIHHVKIPTGYPNRCPFPLWFLVEQNLPNPSRKGTTGYHYPTWLRLACSVVGNKIFPKWWFNWWFNHCRIRKKSPTKQTKVGIWIQLQLWVQSPNILDLNILWRGNGWLEMSAL